MGRGDRTTAGKRITPSERAVVLAEMIAYKEGQRDILRELDKLEAAIDAFVHDIAVGKVVQGELRHRLVAKLISIRTSRRYFPWDGKPISSAGESTDAPKSP